MAKLNISEPLLVGRLCFCNVIPFFWKTFEPNLNVSFVDGVPSELNKLLRSGRIDVAPSSSIEYAHNWKELFIHPDLSISGTSEVQSVVLYSNIPFRELDDKNVALSAASDTSVALLKVLSAIRYGITPLFSIKNETTEYDAELLIGDAALEFNENQRFKYTYDLAQEWFNWTGSPFVFGLWIVRKVIAADAIKKVALCAFMQRVQEGVSEFSDNREQAIALWRDHFSVSLTNTQLESYFECMGYGLSNVHQESLNLFFKYCRDIDIIADIPELQFLEC